MTENWIALPVKEVCHIKPSKSEPRSRLAPDALVSFVPMEVLGTSEKCFHPVQTRMLSSVIGSYTYFADGDVLLAKITPCFENGKLGIAEGLRNGVGFGSSEFIVLRPKVVLCRDWLYYWLSRDSFRQEGANRMQGAVGHKRVSKEFVEDSLIPLPPLPEQQRIVRILDEAFESIAKARANAEKNLRNAREVFESHLNEVFTRKGEGWVEKTIGEVCDIKHGFAFDGANFSREVPVENLLVITPGNFTEDGKLLFNEQNTKRFSGDTPAGFRFNIGDLVVVMTDLSSKMKILGKPAFVETDDVLHNQRIGRVVFSNDLVEKRLLYYSMMTEGFLKNIKISATGTMVKHTAPKRIMSNTLTFPESRKEQRAIISKLDDLRIEMSWPPYVDRGDC